jgi:chemotaxis protein CheD
LNASPLNRIVIVGMGDFRAGAVDFSTITTYSLGSCVGVTVYDPQAKVGGMLHAMLPTASINSVALPVPVGKFVDTGLAALIQEVITLGGVKSRLEVKLAGGGGFLDSGRFFKIGERNVAAVRAYLARHRIKLLAADVGGAHPRTMRLHLDTGAVTIDSPEKVLTNL